jgi:NAD(P)-dependent dehydrogenase (short-subunit alcohol dehydrogenase family)
VQAVATAVQKYGRLDGVILNAGHIEAGQVASPDPDFVQKWKQVFEINFFSLLLTVRAALPELRKTEGTIVMVSSGASAKGTIGWGAYASSKAAMNSLARYVDCCCTHQSEKSTLSSYLVEPWVKRKRALPHWPYVLGSSILWFVIPWGDSIDV